MLGQFYQTLTAAQVTEALQNASGMIDDALPSGYQLPLVQWPWSFVQYTCWMAAYILIQARGYNPQNPAELTFETRWKWAQVWLDKLRKNGMRPGQIVDSSNNAQPGQSAPNAAPNTVSPSPTNRTWGTNWRR
jgi:phage gp36-like protein